MKSYSNTKPNKFTFERYPRGGYILWLRENFHEIIKENPETQEVETTWVYDEYTILSPNFLSNEFIEQHFDEYISDVRRREASDIETRLSAVEDAIQDILEILGNME